MLFNIHCVTHYFKDYYRIATSHTDTKSATSSKNAKININEGSKYSKHILQTHFRAQQSNVGYPYQASFCSHRQQAKTTKLKSN